MYREPRTKGLVCYCLTAYCWFPISPADLYASARHHATASYLNHFDLPIGILLVLLTSVLLVGLNWAVVRRGGKRPDAGQRGQVDEWRG